MATVTRRKPFVCGQQVEVQWEGRWLPATIQRCWSDGADVVVGLLGCWYFQWQLIRAGS